MGSPRLAAVLPDSVKIFSFFPHLDNWLPLVHLGDHGQVEDHRVKQVHQVAPKNIHLQTEKQVKF